MPIVEAPKVDRTDRSSSGGAARVATVVGGSSDDSRHSTIGASVGKRSARSPAARAANGPAHEWPGGTTAADDMGKAALDELEPVFPSSSLLLQLAQHISEAFLNATFLNLRNRHTSQRREKKTQHHTEKTSQNRKHVEITVTQAPTGR
jgi:hypothetical protein